MLKSDRERHEKVDGESVARKERDSVCVCVWMRVVCMFRNYYARTTQGTPLHICANGFLTAKTHRVPLSIPKICPLRREIRECRESILFPGKDILTFFCVRV